VHVRAKVSAKCVEQTVPALSMVSDDVILADTFHSRARFILANGHKD